MLHLDKLPFYVGLLDSPAGSGLPLSLPFTLGFDDDLGLIVQQLDEQVDLWVETAYQHGSSLSTPVGEGSFGGVWAEDVLNALRACLGDKGFERRSFLEVGCNTGYLLHRLKQEGASHCLGVDPSPSSSAWAEQSGVEIIQDFFDPDAMEERFDLVFSHGVLEHVRRPLEFLAGLKACTKEGGIVFTAVPDCAPGLSLGDLSLLAHEHRSYFTARSLRSMYERAGLRPTRSRTPAYGWMLQMWASAASGTSLGMGLSKGDILEERMLLARYERLCARIVERIQNMIYEMEKQGRSIGIYGAYPHFMLFDWGEQPRCFDGDAAKHGKYLPGCGSQVESPQALTATPVDSIWVAPIHHDAAIRSFLEHELGVPSARIVSMKEVYEAQKAALEGREFGCTTRRE